MSDRKMIVNENQLKNILLITPSATQSLTPPVTISTPGSARTELLNIFKSMLLNNEDLSSEAIHAKFSPEPDLIIIEGEHSLQNAAIVEASYAELYFCDVYDENEKQKAIEDFKIRKRNFGV